MARLARVVVPGGPHHLTQRGNRRQQTFFSDDDHAAYRDQLAESCGRAGVAEWVWCPMLNHVHLIPVLDTANSLRMALADAHRRYSRRINVREGWRGYLWQGRFASVAMDEPHPAAAARYVEMNPVRAKLVVRAEDWRWSRARAHLSGRHDGLVQLAPLLDRFADWADFLDQRVEDGMLAAIRSGERTGRPMGSDSFVAGLEATMGRKLARQRPGRKPTSTSADAQYV